MTVLVVGVGHPDRGDDGVAAAVIEELHRRAVPGMSTALVTSPARLIETCEGHEHVVVVDAIRSHDAPGTIRVCNVTDDALPDPGREAGTHGFGVAAALELARATDRLPRRVVLVTVEAQAFDLGAPLSPAAVHAVPSAADAVVEAVTAAT